ncbi:uncharacterized protein L3040_009204 [Drepanopeziza brunnea f. sp. 'multigermtubi']|uniref:Putative F-box domain containing protein n=1 Tax=Marssonina brunnea f. sp. multigermtubi (strain MB_m1) TaxID=1072389 RepID=K1X2A5_MARBU|nr:putative F-box domain containing protein [Drepanopeziza brunnea f. sp. 'multigermtubi' MB_m1]EKD19356.1 putative F-box domain containing protein [Drepanopeziza brunnea f. sp. 'multigermtubi' MB_m1]KAJ5032607.1 hypothetical protein L3040_009204 [Drepanopeziza brunnea f. sp. 'multigermtubi']
MTSSLPIPDLALSGTASQLDQHLFTASKTSATSQASHAMKATDLSDDSDGYQMGTPASIASEKMVKQGLDARTKISNLLKDKEQEWTQVLERRKGPLRLLDLPLDVLKEIVKEVTHTNDLTALALTHSALHTLAIPHIYSRFDIVWPDTAASTDSRTGVDALTYGLATLCMGDVFTDHTNTQSFACMNCGTENIAQCSHGLKFGPGSSRRRLGNQYPQFTRKFSLGNGPAEWVQEYLITKESGKMLGTLVALAVARMVHLETFVWDMPTGVLRDVWLALSSLQTRSSSQECRLERVWVRWHDNSDPTNPPSTQGAASSSSTTPQILAGSQLTSVGWTIPPGSPPNPHISDYPISYSQSRVEYPTLSVLPPLKSISVLDIDELDYLDEMSVLIAKSRDRLRELRVGISAKAVSRDFAIAWDGTDLQQVDHKAQWPGASTIGERRLGGVLGVLLGRVFDIRKKQKPKVERKDRNTSMASSTPIPPEVQPPSELDTALNHIPDPLQETSQEPHWSGKEGLGLTDAVLSSPFNADESAPPNTNGLDSHPPHFSSSILDSSQSDVQSLTALISAHELGTGIQDVAINPGVLQHEVVTGHALRRSHTQSQKQSHFQEPHLAERDRLDGKLKLQTLELERIPLSVAVLQKAFDWSILTNLTILDCAQHANLWLMLRRHFQPTALGISHASKHGANVQYHLNLKKIHTDAASPALISFLKETLAPNTLETLFLQDRRRPSAAAAVTIDAIYRGPLKRHRASLKRLMLDSSDKIPRAPNNASENVRWRAWMPNLDVLNFITSGRMSSLRELSIAIEYSNWHHFLQRLPQIPHLRSLNIPFIADHVTPAYDPRELALQVVDVIVLRPEVELCYIGVSHKCFEILENRPHDDLHGSADAHSSAAHNDEEDEEDEDGSDEDDDEEEEEDNSTAIGAPLGIDPDETESEMSDRDSDTDSWDGSDDGRSNVRLRLREILFYDDKVSIFKARHGKL